jgi:acetyl-CoA C-acetyltransferase
MIETAENLARQFGIPRRAADELAVESHRRAAHAWDDGVFVDEVIPVKVTSARGETTYLERDEGIRPDSDVDTLGRLRPLIAGGSVTAGNSAQQNDAAAA